MHLLESAHRIEELLSDDDSGSDAEDKRSNTAKRIRSKAAVEKVFFADVKPFVLDGSDMELLPQDTSVPAFKHVHAQIFGRNNNAKPTDPPPLPALAAVLPPVSPVVLSTQSSSTRPMSSSSMRRHQPKGSWEVPEPLTATADEVTTIEDFS
ncbi:hypothetical protein H310_06901 [Aphanomyces invadans]|uniref:Uncharacterized protein n=1 Tax=Aphanomyces invadans TaxID=157072 RepID=A0A024U6W5_9STRA|nr:hypothetical protein H310_06901 [Aphanomyces invadans]ETW01343.1 hypothetical protein H310_06901 [Aphanomyces invadans]|eukprot:XP_008870341.1 hypothetical protein H310_06901 [Aphanomyces invadans]